MFIVECAAIKSHNYLRGMNSMKIFNDAFSKFVELLKNRVTSHGERFITLSQEAFISFLFGYSIIEIKKDFLDKIFIEYPIETKFGSRDKIDLYLDIYPGYYVEVKYVRPIPSGMNRPFPQHRGKMIDDVLKLCILTPNESNKYLLLVADEEFIGHLNNKPGFSLKYLNWHGAFNDLVVNKTERRQVRNFEEIKEREIDLVIKRAYKLDTLVAVLWKINCSSFI